MMTITTGGELRQLGLLGIQMGAVDRFIIEVFPSIPPLQNTFLLLQDGRCQGVIVTVVFSGSLFFFLTSQRRHQLGSLAGVSPHRRRQTTLINYSCLFFFIYLSVFLKDSAQTKW